MTQLSRSYYVSFRRSLHRPRRNLLHLHLLNLIVITNSPSHGLKVCPREKNVSYNEIHSFNYQGDIMLKKLIIAAITLVGVGAIARKIATHNS